jgi:hypothetical protein
MGFIGTTGVVPFHKASDLAGVEIDMSRSGCGEIDF